MKLITPLDVRDGLIAQISNDPSMPADLLPLLAFDPTTISENEAQHCCIVIPGANFSQGALGGRGIGQKEVDTRLVVITRVWQETRGQVTQDQCLDLTYTLLETIWHVEQALLNGTNQQLWYEIQWPREPMTVNHYNLDSWYQTNAHLMLTARAMKS